MIVMSNFIHSALQKWQQQLRKPKLRRGSKTCTLAEFRTEKETNQVAALVLIVWRDRNCVCVRASEAKEERLLPGTGVLLVLKVVNNKLLSESYLEYGPVCLRSHFPQPSRAPYINKPRARTACWRVAQINSSFTPLHLNGVERERLKIIWHDARRGFLYSMISGASSNP